MNPEVTTLQAVLNQLSQHLVQMSAQLINVSRAIAGFLALCYIVPKIWGHLTRAEPIDFYPLLRPFGIGIAILFYSSLLSLVNGILQPTVDATQSMVGSRQQAIAVLLQNRADAQPPTNGGGDIVDDIRTQVSRATFDFKGMVQEAAISILEWLFLAASLIISVLRSFILAVLGILGPLVLALSVLDGFRQSFIHWLARYIHVYLWLPIANIYGAIMAEVQLLMLQMDTSTDFAQGKGAAYIIFLLMGIVGYMCVPSTASYIVQTFSGHALLSKAGSIVSGALKKPD